MVEAMLQRPSHTASQHVKALLAVTGSTGFLPIHKVNSAGLPEVGQAHKAPRRELRITFTTATANNYVIFLYSY